MERLTKRTPEGVALCGDTREEMEAAAEAALNRLAAYEESGFTSFRVMALAEAEKFGLLVVLEPEKAKYIKKILAERERQDKKWGYPQENTYCEWASILAEEFGELSKELNELNFGRGDPERMEAEAVQVAAVALSILEQATVAHSTTVTAAMALGRIRKEEVRIRPRDRRREEA